MGCLVIHLTSNGHSKTATLSKKECKAQQGFLRVARDSVEKVISVIHLYIKICALTKTKQSEPKIVSFLFHFDLRSHIS